MRFLRYGLLFLFLSFSLHAGDNSQLVDATNLGRINVTEGGLIEGEHIDLRTGNVYWETTDLVIPGNGKMDIAVSRSFNKTAFHHPGEFLNWQLETPRILSAFYGNPVAAGEGRYATGGICGEPRGIESAFWSGLQLVIPGDPPRELFFRSPNANQFLATVKYVTADNWMVECRTSSKNATYRKERQNDTDVFLVTAPDGRRFWLDQVERRYGNSGIDRYEGVFFPSWMIIRASWVEDVHGNRVEYQYNVVRKPIPYYGWGTEPPYDTLYRLQKITASDGRIVNFVYSKSGYIILKITANEKTWQYRYKRGLEKVIRPDGHAWQYQHQGPPVFTYGEVTAPLHLTHVETPGGATIDYTAQQISAGHFLGFDSPYQIPVLATRTVKGSNLKEATWKYSFSGRDGFTVTTVKAPEHTEVHEFYRTLDWRLGLPYSKGTYNKDSAQPLRQEIYEWANSPSFGDSHIPREAFVFLNEGIQKRVTKLTVDGKYITGYQDHDVYGNPQKIIETGTESKTTHRTYLNQTSAHLWRIGLPKDEQIEGGGSIVREYDALGDVIKLTEYGITTTFDYHPTGDLKSKTQAGQATFFENYYRGQAQTIAKPENVIIRKAINDTGTIASETDGEGHTTRYSYDVLNRLIQIIPPIQEPTRIEWKTPTTKTITKGRYQETVTMDPFERPFTQDKVDTHTNEHIITKTEYDSEGRITYQSEPLSPERSETGRRTMLDGLGRPTQITHTGDGSTTLYTYEGNKITITRPSGFKTQALYRIFGEPKNKELLEIHEQITPQTWKTTTLTRDKLGNITSVKQGPITRLFQYESNHPKLLQKQYDPEIGWTHYTYDAAGNKTSEAIENQDSTKYTYDGLNRLLQIDYPKETPDVFYQYDKDHHVTELKKGTTDWQYQYNERGQLTEEKLRFEPDEFSIGYQYDPEGNPESLTYPTGITIHYQPDAFGRPTQVGDSIRNFGYFPNGQLKTFYNINDVLTTYTQNKRGWPESILTQKDGKPLVTQAYQYDKEGNLTQSQIQNNNQTFSYDGLNQLIEAKGSWGESNFQYDTTGNILQKTIGKEQLTYTYTPDQNRLTKITGTQNQDLIYDDRGNLSVKGKALFSFDEARNLTALLGTHTKTLYRYDGNHHRTMIQQGETVTYTIHNQAGQLLVEYTPSHSKTYLYHRNQLMARIDKAGNQESIHYYHTDLLGSPIAQSNQQSQLDWQETYAPYGKRLLQQSQDNQQWYTGKTEDKETGFIYLNARYYDPEIARFISPDPIHFTEQNPMSFNRYAYANNNPLTVVDREGEAACYVLFQDMPIEYTPGKASTWLGGHAGILGYESNGATRYYEYGRYAPNSIGIIGVRLDGNLGNIRRLGVPDLKLDQYGQPTLRSFETLRGALSRVAGKGTPATLMCDRDTNEKRTYEYIERFANNKNRLSYDWKPWSANHCRTFAQSSMEAGR